MQGKWIKIAAAAIAVPVVTISALHLVRAYEAGTTFQPVGSSRDLQVNQVVFSGDEDTASQKDNTDQNGERESELWEKDKTAEDSLGPNLRNNANYLFQTGKANLPDGAENINLAGEEAAANNAILPGENTNQTGNGNYVYDVTGDTDNADLVISGNGQAAGSGTGTENGTGTDIGNGKGQGENTPAGTPGPSEPSQTPMPTPRPTARPADTVKDPQPSKPTPDGTSSGWIIDYKFEEDTKYKDDDVLIIGSLNPQEYELYKGQKITTLDIFCVLDAGVIEGPKRYLWGIEDLDRYIRIDGVSFDEGKTWISSSKFPTEIPMNAEKMWIKAFYRLTETGEWKEYNKGDISYGLKDCKIYVLSRKLTEDDSVIPEECILNSSIQRFPQEGSYINLYQLQEKYIQQTQPGAWYLTELFSNWTENGEPVDWMYEVTPGRHILEPADTNPVPDGYWVTLSDYMIDGENCPLQTLESWNDDVVENGVLDVPTGIQAVEPFAFGDIPTVDTIIVPADTLSIDMSSLIVNKAFSVSKENTRYSSDTSGWLLNRSGTELLAIPYQTTSIKVPNTIKKIDLPGFNDLEKMILTSQNKEQIPEIITDGIANCEIIVPDELIIDFYEKNPIVCDEIQNVSILSDHGTKYYLENAKIVSEDGNLRRVQQSGSSVSLTANIRRIQKGAFQRSDEGSTANMLILSEKGETVTLEKGCFDDSDIRYIQCYTEEQAKNVKEQLEKQNVTGISIQTVGTSKEGFRYVVIDDENQKTTILLKAPSQLKSFEGTVTAQDGSKVGITAIGDNAFSECKNLKWVILPESVDTIGYEAFCGCTSLQGILISTTDSITIGNRSMEECPNLRFVASNAMHAVRVADYDPDITDQDNGHTKSQHYFYVLYGAEGYGGNSLYFNPSSDENSNVRKYTLIDLDQAGECKGLYGANDIAGNWIAVRFGTQVPEQLKLPNSTVEIFEYALAGTVSDTATGTFTLNWTELTKLQYIDVHAFENSGVSGEVRFGSGLNYELGDYAFAGCTEITTVELPGTAIKLGEFAFVNCTGLFKISYGPMLASAAIYSDCFDGCAKLKEIHFADGSANLVFISYSPGVAFYFNMGSGENYDEGISLITPENNKEAYIKKWRYMFAGYVPTQSNQTAYLEMWNSLIIPKMDWDTGQIISYTPEEVDVILKDKLLQAENHLRRMFKMGEVQEPTDFYPYHIDDDGFITLVGAPSDVTEVRLDAAALELPDGWCLDYVATDAFKNSKNLKKVTFPAGFAGIYSNAFRGVESSSLTLQFEGLTPDETPPALMGDTEEKAFTFGVNMDKVNVIVPDEWKELYYEAWKDYGVTIAGYNVPATMSVSGGDVKVSVSDGDAKPQSKQDASDTSTTQEETIQ